MEKLKPYPFCVQQMQLLFDIRDDVNKFTMVKLERLKERIDERDS